MSRSLASFQNAPCAVIGLVLACFGSLAQAGLVYGTPQVFSRPGATAIQLWDISSQGQLVGQSVDAVRAEGFVFANGDFTPVMPGWATSSAVTGISDTGVMIGTYGMDEPNPPAFRSFLYENGAYSAFSMLGTSEVLLRRISANGRYMTGSVVSANLGPQSFVYDRVTATARLIPIRSGSILQGVTSQGLAVGNALGTVTYAFSFDTTTGVLTPYTGNDLGNRPRFRDINDSGLIAGYTGTQAFVGKPGDWTFFDPPSGMFQAVGYGLNNRGELIGNYVGAAGTTQAFVSSPVPEPAAWALLAGGLALLAWRRRPA